MKKALLASLLLIGLSGCVANPDEPQAVQVESLGPQALSQVEALIRHTAGSRNNGERVGFVADLAQVGAQANGFDPVSEAVRQMAAQLSSGLDENRVRRLPMAILQFHELVERQRVGEIGERLSDSFIFQLEHLGYNLVDYRAVSLTTTAKQEPDPSSLSLLRSRNRIYFVLTGTYAVQPEGMVINARVLDTTTRQVLASAQSHIPLNRLEGAWPGYDPVRAADAGMIVENRQGPAGM
ncbi:Flagellar protein FlgO [Marinobacterium lacunae]|uniref:Flagellar protein FlgO n=1 Tax=Marinobacterium lacunae TaxID=1232683 RepID=A0A081G0S7_9GAMM|nr:FlgO family outer membrane protein [Marinobacterium lacunae]KEA64382.1 Flagellar protein FlgO [Marinobacterium lacunae]